RRRREASPRSDTPRSRRPRGIRREIRSLTACLVRRARAFGLSLDYYLCREFADHELAILPARELSVDAGRARRLRLRPDEDEAARGNLCTGGNVEHDARALLLERIGERAIRRTQALDFDPAAAQPRGGDAGG